MSLPWNLSWKRCWSYCVATASRWLETPPKHLSLRPGLGLEFALLPHQASCRWVAAYLGLQVVYCGYLLFLSQWLLGILGLGICTAGALAWRSELSPTGPSAPRRLRVLETGQLLLFTASGRVEAVSLRSSSIWLGSLLVLVVQGRRRYLLLLGSANVPAPTLASLRRRLRRVGLNGSQLE
jgi:hypothetical protein